MSKPLAVLKNLATRLTLSRPRLNYLLISNHTTPYGSQAQSVRNRPYFKPSLLMTLPLAVYPPPGLPVGWRSQALA